MGYYIRVLATTEKLPTLAELQQKAAPALLEVEEGEGDQWQSLLLQHKSGEAIALIERNPVVAGELGADELEEFIEEVENCEPASAAAWLKDYLPGIKVIYAFQFLNGTEIEGGFDRLQETYGELWKAGGGILQADGEGFSNEEGNTILWQFAEDVSGEWNAAVLAPDLSWTSFRMELGDPVQRAAFQRGEVPAGAKLL